MDVLIILHRWMDEKMDGWMDGWKNGWINELTDLPLVDCTI